MINWIIDRKRLKAQKKYEVEQKKRFELERQILFWKKGDKVFATVGKSRYSTYGELVSIGLDKCVIRLEFAGNIIISTDCVYENKSLKERKHKEQVNKIIESNRRQEEIISTFQKELQKL